MKKLLDIKTILLDMDGVLWQGSEPLIDIPDLFDRIQDLGFQIQEFVRS